MTDMRNDLTLDGLEAVIEGWIAQLRRVHLGNDPVHGSSEDGVTAMLRAMMRMHVLVAMERVGSGECVDLGALLGATLTDGLRSATLGDTPAAVRSDPRIAKHLAAIATERFHVALAALPEALREEIEYPSTVRGDRDGKDPAADATWNFLDAARRLMRLRTHLVEWPNQHGGNPVEVFGEDVSRLFEYTHHFPSIRLYFDPLLDDLQELLDTLSEDVREQFTTLFPRRTTPPEGVRGAQRPVQSDPLLETVRPDDLDEESAGTAEEATGSVVWPTVAQGDPSQRKTLHELAARDPARNALAGSAGAVRPVPAGSVGSGKSPGNVVAPTQSVTEPDRESDEVPIHRFGRDALREITGNPAAVLDVPAGSKSAIPPSATPSRGTRLPVRTPPTAPSPTDGLLGATTSAELPQKQTPTMQIRTRKYPPPK